MLLISSLSHIFDGIIIFSLSNSVLSQIDVLVNNGGRSQRSLCAETNLDVFQALMDLNFLGTVSVTKRVLPYMMQQGRGSIVTVSSIVGLAGAPLQTGYTASKHALQVRGTHPLFSLQLINAGQINHLCVCRVSSIPFALSSATFQTYSSAQCCPGLCSQRSSTTLFKSK